MFSFIEKVIFVFFILSIIISMIPLIKFPNKEIPENSKRITDFIIKGTKIVLHRFYIYLFVTVVLFITLGILMRTLNDSPTLKIFLIIPSLITSCLAGWLSLHFSMKAIKTILGHSGKSSIEILTLCNTKSNFISTFWY